MKIKALLLRPLVLKFKFYKKSDMTIVISIKSKDTIKALHISVFKVRIAWRCIAIITKSPNRSVSILLRSHVSICFTQEKDLSPTVDPTGMTVGMTHIIRNSREFEQNVPTVNHFVVPMQGDLHLINLLWNYAGRSRIWYCFSARDWVGPFVLFWSCLRMNMHSW